MWNNACEVVSRCLSSRKEAPSNCWLSLILALVLLSSCYFLTSLFIPFVIFSHNQTKVITCTYSFHFSSLPVSSFPFCSVLLCMPLTSPLHEMSISLGCLGDLLNWYTQIWTYGIHTSSWSIVDFQYAHLPSLGSPEIIMKLLCLLNTLCHVSYTFTFVGFL